MDCVLRPRAGLYVGKKARSKLISPISIQLQNLDHPVVSHGLDSFMNVCTLHSGVVVVLLCLSTTLCESTSVTGRIKVVKPQPHLTCKYGGDLEVGSLVSQMESRIQYFPTLTSSIDDDRSIYLLHIYM